MLFSSQEDLATMVDDSISGRAVSLDSPIFDSSARYKKDSLSLYYTPNNDCPLNLPSYSTRNPPPVNRTEDSEQHFSQQHSHHSPRALDNYLDADKDYEEDELEEDPFISTLKLPLCLNKPHIYESKSIETTHFVHHNLRRVTLRPRITRDEQPELSSIFASTPASSSYSESLRRSFLPIQANPCTSTPRLETFQISSMSGI